jgi:hypothetical protein
MKALGGSEDLLVIQCGDGLIAILEWEPESAVVDA